MTSSFCSFLKNVLGCFLVVGSKSNLQGGVDDLLDLVVHDEDESASGSSEDVGEGSLEEGSHSFILGDLGPAVERSVVELFLSSGLHHESSSDGVEGVRDDSTGDGDGLGDGPLGDDAGVLLSVAEDGSLGRVIKSEVGSSVDHDTLDGHAESLVQSERASLGRGLLEAVDQSGELSLASGSDISGQSGSGKVKWVHNGQGRGTGETSTGEVGHEEWQELGLGVVLGEESLDGVLEGEVEGLGWEVSHHVGQVTSPERTNTLLRGDAAEAVDDAGVPWHLSGDDGRVGILGLDEELDSLDGGDEGLGDSSGDATGSEISEELQGAVLLLSVGDGELPLGRHKGGGHRGHGLVGLGQALQGARRVQGLGKHLFSWICLFNSPTQWVKRRLVSH
mmetsp:Transcript_10385/g.26648  ORF Transcript_10385/g.26648 Transcript_10385/m.26648 type:complete len:392 (+) Transcript_10385:95-1270(+)